MEAIAEDNSEAQKGRDALTWKPLRLLTFYRLILAGMLLALYLGLEGNSTLGSTNPHCINSHAFFISFSAWLQDSPHGCAGPVTNSRPFCRFWSISL